MSVGVPLSDGVNVPVTVLVDEKDGEPLHTQNAAPLPAAPQLVRQQRAAQGLPDGETLGEVEDEADSDGEGAVLAV